MRSTKKIITFLCIFGMAVSMTACGASDSKETDEEAAQNRPTSVILVEDELVKPEPEPAKEPEKEETAPVVEKPEVEEPADEPIIEEPEADDTSNLSNDDWVKSLDLEKGTFFIFNESTGERKILEDGQQYIIQEGDELAYRGPRGWDYKGIVPSYMDHDVCKLKYHCNFVDMDTLYSDLTEGEYKEIVVDYKDFDGNLYSTNLYITK